MTISDLIRTGEEAKSKCYYPDGIDSYIYGQQYEEWLTLAARYMISNYKNDREAERFYSIAQRANGRDPDCFDTLIGILKAFEQCPPNNQETDLDTLLKSVFTNFHRCARKILNRHSNRKTLEIADEYDVQDLLHGILSLFIDDIRPEDYVPSYAGGNSRTDFYLPEHDMFIETKMTRDGLKDKEVGEQLIIDVARYKSRCKKLICFIYDKASLLQNPYGLISDLEALSTDEIQVTVFISPL